MSGLEIFGDQLFLGIVLYKFNEYMLNDNRIELLHKN